MASARLEAAGSGIRVAHSPSSREILCIEQLLHPLHCLPIWIEQFLFTRSTDPLHQSSLCSTLPPLPPPPKSSSSRSPPLPFLCSGHPISIEPGAHPPLWASEALAYEQWRRLGHGGGRTCGSWPAPSSAVTTASTSCTASRPPTRHAGPRRFRPPSNLPTAICKSFWSKPPRSRPLLQVRMEERLRRYEAHLLAKEKEAQQLQDEGRREDQAQVLPDS